MINVVNVNLYNKYKANIHTTEYKRYPIDGILCVMSKQIPIIPQIPKNTNVCLLYLSLIFRMPYEHITVVTVKIGILTYVRIDDILQPAMADRSKERSVPRYPTTSCDLLFRSLFSLGGGGFLKNLCPSLFFC